MKAFSFPLAMRLAISCRCAPLGLQNIKEYQGPSLSCDFASLHTWQSFFDSACFAQTIIVTTKQDQPSGQNQPFSQEQKLLRSRSIGFNKTELQSLPSEERLVQIYNQ